MASTSTSVPPAQAPLFSEGIFSSQLWKAVGLIPRHLNAARSHSSHERLAQSSGGQLTTTSSKGNFQDGAPTSRCGGVPSTSEQHPRASQADFSPHAAGNKRRRSSNNVNQSSPKGTTGGGKTVKAAKGVNCGCFLKAALKLSTSIPRKPRSKGGRRPAAALSLLKSLLQLDCSEGLVSPKLSEESEISLAGTNEATAMTMLSPSRSSSPREDVKKMAPVPAVTFKKKLNLVSSEEEDTLCHAVSASDGFTHVQEPSAAACNTPQTVANEVFPISIF